MFDKFNDECAIFGIANHPEAANLTYLGLYAMQHRGQESAGIASADGHRVMVSKEMGYVADIFDSARLASLAGQSAIGHTTPNRLVMRVGGRIALDVPVDLAEQAWKTGLERYFTRS